MAKFSEWVGKVFSTTDHEPIITIFGGRATHSGKTVTAETSLQLSTAWACIRLLTETVSTFPINMLRNETRRGGEEVRIRDNSHPLAMILKKWPNPRNTPVEFMEAMQLNLLTWGNCYAEIEKNSLGRIVSLNPLLARNMEVKQLEDSSVWYHYSTSKGVLIYPAEAILHVKLFSWGGITGLSPIAYAAQSMGLALAAEEFGARFFGAGGRPSGFLMYPGTLKEPQREQLRKNFENLHEGLERSHKLALLEADMKYQPSTIPPNEAQFLETREFSVPEICRWYLVPPHKIQHLAEATYNNIESQNLEYVKTTVAPYVTRYEQSFERALLTPAERMTWSIRMNLKALLRADSEARSKYLSTMVQNGMMTRNEARALEDYNRSDQEGADDLTVQANMIDLDQLTKVGA